MSAARLTHRPLLAALLLVLACGDDKAPAEPNDRDDEGSVEDGDSTGKVDDEPSTTKPDASGDARKPKPDASVADDDGESRDDPPAKDAGADTDPPPKGASCLDGITDY